jgi:hypothetical protein
MQPFLLQLKRRFTQYNLKCFMRLSSQHSMRIYELLKMREGIKYLRLRIEELREILSCEHSYGRFADFKRWVLERARKELGEKTDIYFNYQVEREGQTPVRINFVIKQNDSENRKEGGGKDEDENKTLIQSGQDGKRGDIGVEEKKMEADEVERPTFNVFAMVLDEMTQEELDTYSETHIREAVSSARQKVGSDRPDDGAANKAIEAYREALRRVRD